MRVIIAGGRDFNNYELLHKKMNEIFSQLSSEKYLTNDIQEDVANMEIISGKARGADTLGERFAKDYGISIKEFPADWNKFGKSAGHRRNAEMAKYASESDSLGVLVAFWDGKSRGTKNMIDLAKRYGLRVFVTRYDK